MTAGLRGLSDGRRVEVSVRTEFAGPDTFFWQSMGTATRLDLVNPRGHVASLSD